MSKPKFFFFLYRNESGQRVWQGGYFKISELEKMLNDGWKKTW